MEFLFNFQQRWRGHMAKRAQSLSRFFAFFSGIVFIAYLLSLLSENILSSYQEANDLPGFFRWLLGLALILVIGFTVAALNYRYVYRTLVVKKEFRWWYVTCHVTITWLIFELLQSRTEREPELVGENLLVTIFISLFLLAFAWFTDSLEAKKNQAILLKQKVEAELRALQYQINPHFLFNALNTIYSQALEQNRNDLVADLVHKLSSMLRFTLVQSKQERIAVEEELLFVEHLIDLHRARLPPSAKDQLILNINWDERKAFIAPLLLLPFIENAIQYGLNPLEPGVVSIDLIVDNGNLKLLVDNPLHPTSVQKNKGTGHGIANVRQRLNLLYANRYQLVIREENGRFQVLLEIKL